MTPLSTPGATGGDSRTDYDAVVIGAGFGGIYILHKLRNELGLTVRAYDRAGGVGGTWYWNRYPGALSDTEGFVYRYSFDKDLLQEYDWSSRYLKQPDILAYLEHVVERFDLAKDIQLNTGVTAAAFDEGANSWTITTDRGETVTATYLVTALGLLSKINMPDIPGIDTFRGEIIHTGAWPEEHDLRGKKVGVIGNGSTGQQVILAYNTPRDMPEIEDRLKEIARENPRFIPMRIMASTSKAQNAPPGRMIVSLTGSGAC